LTDAQLSVRQNLALLVARLGMASLFLFSGSEKLIDAAGAAEFAASFGVPLAAYTVPIAAIFEIGCALTIASGWHARSAAVALALWMTVLNPWFHPFWKVPPQVWQLIIDSFFHHFVMIGGMIYLAVFGPGRLVIAKSRT
jgi:putative oxidoreductase